MLKYLILSLFISFSLISVAQNFYLGIPYDKVVMNDCDIVIMPQLSWDFNRTFSQAGLRQIDDIVDFISNYPDFDFEIILFGDKNRLNDYEEKLLEKKALLAKKLIISHKSYDPKLNISVIHCLESKFKYCKFTSKENKKLYKNFSEALSNRVEIRFKSK